jgi:hypothetical protein
VDDNRKLSNPQTRVSLMVIPESLITTCYEWGVQIFRQEGVTIDLVEMSRKRSGFQST